MRLLAPAKINLHLRVGPRRDDGFHPLLSWMCSVGLFDTLDFERARRDGLILSSDAPGLAVDQSNLIVRAATALADYSTRPNQVGAAFVGGIAARLDKKIPVGAGLGGGSSDAARTLLGLNKLCELGLSLGQLAELAAKLGSDLPFFLHLPSAVCTGRGEFVRPIDPPRVRWCMLVLPDFPLATPAVYRRFDEMSCGNASAISDEPDWKQWSTFNAQSLLALLINDLEAPAFAIRPELGQLRADIEQDLSRIVRMSGSGSSLFTLFDSQDQARLAVERITTRLKTRAISVELAPLIRDDLHDDR